MPPRLQGLLIFVVGLCFAVAFGNQYRAGKELFSDKLLVLTPVLLLFGLLTMIDPRILLIIKWEDGKLPVLVRIGYTSLLLLAAAFGWYIRYTLYR